MYRVASCLLSLVVTQGFHGKLVLQDGDQRTSYGLDLKEGAVRIDPEETDVYLLLDVPSKTVTLVDRKERFYCTLESRSFRLLMELGTIRLSWFPWVYRPQLDLVENLSIEMNEGIELPNGKPGVGLVMRSKTYDRVIAEYWLDPELPADLFLQWRTIYHEFWGESEGEPDRAQQTRLEIYGDMVGFPWRVEERFSFLSRPRTMELERLGPIPEDAFSIPPQFVEKTANEIWWESLLRSLERWLPPRSGSIGR